MRLPRKELTCLAGAPILATVTQETFPDLLLWKPTGVTIADPEDCKYFHTLKAAA